MATKAERKLEKHGKNVVSIKDRIKGLQEQLKQEKEREQEAKNTALVELVNSMNVSYGELKDAVNAIKEQLANSAVQEPQSVSKKTKTVTAKGDTVSEVAQGSGDLPFNTDIITDFNSEITKENKSYDNEIG